MLRIAFSTLRYHKKITAFFFALLLLVFALVLTIFPLFNYVISSIADTGAIKYGKQDIILYNLNNTQLAALQKNFSSSKIGIVETYGSWQIAEQSKEGSITLGYFDDVAWELSCISLLEGFLPQNEGEIALEQSARYRLGIDFAVGDQLTFTQQGVQKNFTVCGILRNYTNTWDVPSSNQLIPGYNDMPKGIITHLKQPPIINIHTLCYTDGYSRDISIAASEWGVQQSASGSYYSGVLIEQLAPLKTFRNIFVMLIFFGVVLCINTGLSLYIDAYRPTYQTLYDLGAEAKHPFLLFGLQQAILLPAAALCSLPLAWCIARLADLLLQGRTQIHVFTPGNLLLLIIATIFLCVLVLFRFYSSIYALKKKPLSQYTAQRSKQMHISSSLSWSLTINFMDTTLKKVLPILLLVAFLFSAVSFTNVYVKDFLLSNVFQSLEEQRPDWRLYDFSIECSNQGYATFETLNLNIGKNRYFPKEVIHDLYALSGIDFVHIYTYGLNKATLLLPDNGDPYWKSFDCTWPEDKDLGYPSSAISGAPQSVISIDPYFYVLDEILTPSLKAAYPDMALAIDTLKKDEVLALLPPVDALNNQTLALDYELDFGELTYSHNNFAEVRANPNLITYREHHLTVAAVYDRPLEVYIKGRKEVTFVPVFLITEETFRTNSLFKGIERLHLYLSPDISEADYAVVEQHVMEIGASLDNVQVYSRREEQAQDAQFMAVTSAALAITLGILGIFIFFCLFTTLYMALLHRKHSLSILRSLGMKRRTLARAVFIELTIYMLYCLFLSILLYFLIMFLFYREIFASIVTWQNTLHMLQALGGCLLAVLLICSGMVRALLRGFYRESISTALRSAE